MAGLLAFTFLAPFIAICLGVAVFAFWIYTIIFVLNAEHGQDRTTWILVVILLHFLGAMIYHIMRGRQTNSAGQTILLIGMSIVGLLFLACCGLTFIPLGPGSQFGPGPQFLTTTPFPNILTAMAETVAPGPTPTRINIQNILTSIAVSTQTPVP